MRQLARPLLIVVLVLLVPIVPFLLLGGGFEERLQTWFTAKVSPVEVAWAVVLLLAVDIVLPVLSSVVSTLAGARLGIAAATFYSWLGMTIGSVVGFGLASWFGDPLARRLVQADDLQRMQAVANRLGVYALAVTRPVPVLAEATIFLLGTTRLAWRKFLPVACLSNLAIAFVYSLLGWLSYERGQFAIALVASIGLPVAATLLARWLLPRSHTSDLESVQ